MIEIRYRPGAVNILERKWEKNITGREWGRGEREKERKMTIAKLLGGIQILTSFKSFSTSAFFSSSCWAAAVVFCCLDFSSSPEAFCFLLVCVKFTQNGMKSSASHLVIPSTDFLPLGATRSGLVVGVLLVLTILRSRSKNCRPRDGLASASSYSLPQASLPHPLTLKFPASGETIHRTSSFMFRRLGDGRAATWEYWRSALSRRRS